MRQVQQSIENAKSENISEDWNKSWLPILAKHVSAWSHVIDQGLGMYVFMAAQRATLSNMHNAIAANCMHKLRTAQDDILYSLELTEIFKGEFDGKVHQQVWIEDPAWQGVRENVER